MQLNLLITGGLYNSQAAYSAYRFADAALQNGHNISQVFFYQDGVSHGSLLSAPLSDEFDAVKAWQELATQHDFYLVVCIAAAQRRGVVGDEQHSSLPAPFAVQGLGALHQASCESDRTVTFV